MNPIVANDTPTYPVTDTDSDEQQVNIYLKNQHGEIIFVYTQGKEKLETDCANRPLCLFQ
ncbi:hypothetical protein [Companilactobacillus jidongensis]|uniref:hypothetical protein n=1 Tax=Companilactobacillus jidongensis TaxID=2486006 RepID=UPI000F7AF9CE|nr:hypothetical protein [Companilactobacillus jidongensis]